MSETFTIRQATPADMAIIVAHRHQMYEDMGYTDPAIHAAFEIEFVPWLKTRLEDGRYRAWFAVTGQGQVVAGSGLWLQDWPPGYSDWSPFRGYILNVYTHPDYRRRGLARRVVQAAMDWCAAHNIRQVRLHYSDEGKALYEQMGYIHSNEMRIEIVDPALPEPAHERPDRS